MFEINKDTLPIVRTRQALLLLDLQNDFLTTGGLLAVEEPADFLDNILNLLPHFRGSGNRVIWIRSQFEVSRPVNGSGDDCERVVLDGQKQPGYRRAGQRIRNPPQRLLDKHAKIIQNNRREGGLDPGMLEADDKTDNEEEFVVEETYLTIPEGQQPRVVVATSPGTNFAPRALAGFNAAEDLVFLKSYYSAFRDGTLMEFMRAQFITEIYLCGSLTNISVFATAMDAARYGFAITILDDCLGYRSKVRHDEALQQLTVSTGCDIISSEELIADLNHKAQEQLDRASRGSSQRKRGGNLESLMARMALRHFNLSSSSSSSRHSPTTDTSVDINGRETGALTGLTALESGASSDSPHEVHEEVRLERPVMPEARKRERVPAKIKSRRRHSKSRTGDKEPSIDQKRGVSPTSATLSGVVKALENIPKGSDAVSESITASAERNITKSSNLSEGIHEAQDPNPKQSDMQQQFSEKVTTATVAKASASIVRSTSIMASTNTDPIDQSHITTLCEGDTTVIVDLLGPELEKDIFKRVHDEVEWRKMYHQTGEVPRLVAVQGEIGDDGSIPLYRHPADESPPLLPFSPTVSLIRAKVEENLGHGVNHVLIQFYRNSLDHISEHSDKTLDIVPSTFIANVSLGAQRTMLFRTKKPIKTTESSESQFTSPRKSQRAPLPHNSMCKLGLATNMRWMHEIRPDKRQTREKLTEELAFDSGRISLTFRSIGTFLTQDEENIWGQGAIAKRKDDARPVLNGKTPEADALLGAFGVENRSPEFNWQEVYGGGFDVLHISNPRKLFLSGDRLSDLRVKLHLSELNLDWVQGSSPTIRWEIEKAGTGLAAHKNSITFVDNDAAKSTVTGDQAIMLYLEYGYAYVKCAPPRVDLARQCNRLEQSRTLLSRWRTISYTTEEFVRELESWEKFSFGHEFIASTNISIVDFAVWPILDEISRGYDGFKNYPGLSKYYERMKSRPSVSAVIDAPEPENAVEDAKS
jgi:nicotinamidase-related amidase/alkylated DNA repair dioxygenase AlkB